MITFLKRLCIWQIQNLFHFLWQSEQTQCERHYREQKVSDLTDPLLIPPRLQAATLVSRWQASVGHLEQA